MMRCCHASENLTRFLKRHLHPTTGAVELRQRRDTKCPQAAEDPNHRHPCHGEEILIRFPRGPLRPPQVSRRPGSPHPTPLSDSCSSFQLLLDWVVGLFSVSPWGAQTLPAGRLSPASPQHLEQCLARTWNGDETGPKGIHPESHRPACLPSHTPSLPLPWSQH